MPNPGVEVTGVEEMKAKLQQVGERIQSNWFVAGAEEAEAVFQESQKRVPVDEGTLKDSGLVDPPKFS